MMAGPVKAAYINMLLRRALRLLAVFLAASPFIEANSVFASNFNLTALL